LLLELLIAIEHGLRFPVQLLELLQDWLVRLVIRVLQEHVLNQHPELSAPITHVVDPFNIMSLELQYPANGLANNGRPQMPHVHFFGDVRAREINHNFLGITFRKGSSFYILLFQWEADSVT
jgi:hypothetical protein